MSFSSKQPSDAASSVLVAAIHLCSRSVISCLELPAANALKPTVQANAATASVPSKSPNFFILVPLDSALQNARTLAQDRKKTSMSAAWQDTGLGVRMLPPSSRF